MGPIGLLSSAWIDGCGSGGGAEAEKMTKVMNVKAMSKATT